MSKSQGEIGDCCPLHLNTILEASLPPKILEEGEVKKKKKKKRVAAGQAKR